MGPYLGDFAENGTVHCGWDTNAKTGGSITRATDGTISVYKNADTTQSTAGITDNEDFDGITGIHMCVIDLSDAFYAPGNDYTIVLTAATIDDETVNSVLGTFSIENRYNDRNVKSIDNDAITAASIATDAINEIRDAILADSTAFNGADIAAILTDTNEVQGKLPTNEIMGSSTKDNKDDEIDDILVDTGVTIPAIIAALNDLSAAQVNAEMVDVLTVDAMPDIGAATPPPDAASIQAGINYLFRALQNRASLNKDTGKKTFYNAAGSVAYTKDVSDDGTTAEEQKGA